MKKELTWDGFKKIYDQNVSMDRDEIPEGLRKNLLFAGISLIIVVGLVGANNLVTPQESVEVGYTEVHTECAGLDLGVCLGVQHRDHETFNYDNYTRAEEGTEDFYRRVESELMIRAYNTCDQEMEGMEWTDDVEYRNQTATEWLENDNIDLLPCEQAFHRSVDASE